MKTSAATSGKGATQESLERGVSTSLFTFFRKKVDLLGENQKPFSSVAIQSYGFLPFQQR